MTDMPTMTATCQSLRRKAMIALLGLSLLATSALSWAQLASSATGPISTLSIGTPLLKNFAPEEFDAYPQNWSGVQDSRGIIYVGNGENGVLEYDGSQWRRIAVPRQSVVRSLALGEDGRIYVGCSGDFGYLAPDSLGRMRYVSLIDRFAPEERDFADVWKILPTRDATYFSTANRLFRIAHGNVRSWAPEGEFHMSFIVHDQLYIRQVGVGLQRLVDDQLVLVPGSERYANDRIYAMVAGPADEDEHEQSVLIASRNSGFVIFDGEHFHPWRVSNAETLSDNLVYGALWLADGRLAVGTLLGGVVLLDRHGNEAGHIGRAEGLSSDTIYNMWEDREGGLWLALENGIARVEVNSVLTRFNQLNGLDGSVLSLHRHEGFTYAGTSKGLFRLEGSSSAARFSPVSQIPGPAWAMIDMDTSMLVGGAQGIFEIADNGKILQLSEETAQVLLRPDSRTNHLLVGQRNGLELMRVDRHQLVSLGMVEGALSEIRSLHADVAGNVWIGFLSGRSARLTLVRQLDGSITTQVTTQRESADTDSGDLRYSFAGNIDGAIRFSTESGIARVGEDGLTQVPDERFTSLFKSTTQRPSTFAQDSQGDVWIYVDDPILRTKAVVVAATDASDEYHWKPLPLQGLAGKAINVIDPDLDVAGIVWIAASDGLYRYDARLVGADSDTVAPLVRNVSTRGGSVLWGGGGKSATDQLEWSQNSVRFDYAQPRFDSGHANRFQVRLEGMETDWSSWSAETYRDYTNLPAGSYRFRLRSRDEYGKLSEEAEFHFEVMPPWYRSWWAYLVWISLLLLVAAGAMRWRVRALSLRNLALSQLVEERTAALEMANEALVDQTITDALTGLKNRRYVADHIKQDVAQVQRNFHQLTPGHYDHHNSNIHLLFLMIDLDHFKEVNDRYGHAAGDRVLSQLRDILQAATREADTPVRWGGEEFLVIARFASGSVGPLLAERIRSMIAKHPFDLGNDQIIHCTVSVGFAYYPVFAPSLKHFGWEDVINIADQCLYQAKRDGRNCWVGVIPVANASKITELETVPVDLEILVAKGYLKQLAGGPPSDT